MIIEIKGEWRINPLIRMFYAEFVDFRIIYK